MHVYVTVACATRSMCVLHVFVDVSVNPQFVGWNYSTSPICRRTLGLTPTDYSYFRSLCECLICRRWCAAHVP